MTATGVRPAPAPPLGEPPPPRRRIGPALVLAFATAVTLVWTVTAARAAGRGFDLTDEGFYLLSYRWWNVDHRTFSGVQYLYGPVFGLLGHDVAALRLVRLGSVLVVHAVFGYAFMRRLRPPTRLWGAAGTACIVAAGGAIFSWLPHTPGYNDVVILGALLSLAALMSLDRGPRWPLLLGAVLVAMVLTKWSTVLWVAVVLGLLLARPGRLRNVVWTVAGALAAVAAVHLLIVPLGVAVPPIAEVNRLLSERSFAVGELLQRYVRSARPVLLALGRDHGLLLIGVAGAVLARGRVAQIVAGVVGLAGLTWSAVAVIRAGGLAGGPPAAARFVVPMLAVLAVALVAAALAAATMVTRRDGPLVRIGKQSKAAEKAWWDVVLLGAMVAMPVITAAGTSNAPLTMATPGFAVWVAALIAVVSGLERRAVAARGVTGAVLAGALLVTACVATGGLWRHPYRERAYDGATTASGVPALDGLDLRPEQARAYRDLYDRLTPYRTEGRHVVGLDKMAGIVFSLGGRTLGEGWYAPEDPGRTRAGIAAACADGPPWAAGREPIVILNRPVRAADATVLAPCGLDLRRDYRPLAPVGETGGLTVLVPA